MVIYAWDASDYDWDRGPMDVAAARAAGIDIFTHKATEGTSTKHVHYGEMMRRARDAGVPFLAAYHVVRSPRNAAAEVDYCLAYVNAQTPWWKDFPGWFWQIDLERWPYDAVPASEGEDFADIIEQRTGRRAIIYASKGQYGDQLSGTSHPLWNANYGPNNAGDFRALYAARGGDTGPGWAPYSGTTPAIWQYGSNARIGRQNTCDANAYRGTVADFARLIGRPAVANGAEMELSTVVPGTKTSTVRDDRQFGTSFADMYRQRSIEYGEVTPDYPAGSPGAARLAMPSKIDAMAATLSAMKTTLDAVLGLAQQGGGSFDTAAVLQRMQDLADAELARDTAQQQRIAELEAKLAEVQAATDAQLSPAERAVVDGAAEH